MAAHVSTRRAEAGFSMAEMLMAAFIMAVGLLGLTLLQVMALRSTRGSRNLGLATLVAEQILDRAELEGRLSWLNLSTHSAATPNTATDLPGLAYITLAAGSPKVESFNFKGLPVVTASSDPQESNAWFTVTTTRDILPAATHGLLSQFTVSVAYTEAVAGDKTPLVRTVRISRVILHG